MSITAEYPFEKYNLYVVFHKKEGRNYAQLVNPNIREDRTTISYARYLMSVKEKRVLENWEHVDHINEIKSDDRPENLQILTNKENIEKHIFLFDIKRTMVELTCENCGKTFDREIRNYHKSNKFSFCSRRCNGQYYSNKTENLNKKNINHGMTMYVNGCRCEICTEANTERCRKYRENKRKRAGASTG